MDWNVTPVRRHIPRDFRVYTLPPLDLVKQHSNEDEAESEPREGDESSHASGRRNRGRDGGSGHASRSEPEIVCRDH